MNNKIKNYLKQQGNPKELLLNVLENQNPMVNNLIQMAQSGNSKGIENFARNLCKEQGKDFDKEFSNFMQSIKG